jgi:hypothetical protein
MVDTISKYFLALICFYALVINLLRLIKLLFNPIILNHKYFDLPSNKLSIALYYISMILLLLFVVLNQLSII